MRCLKLNNKGFTFIELIVAAVILAIVVAGVYASYIVAVRFIGLFRHEIVAVLLADSILQQVRAGFKYYDPNPDFPAYQVDDNTNSFPDNPPDITRLDNQLDDEVINLQTLDEEVVLEASGSVNQKRAQTTVEWTERNP